MTDQSRGAQSRRGDRGPGWLLLTALLVLAILASSTLVFTNKVELLRLAVVLSLWAAVMAAFVTVIYRRQSEVAQARARDMKHVYDLQLEREISARREYELAVETNLRRQLSHEVRAQAADEMAGLRAELASLRAQLEVMLGTDLGHRPALESERISVPMPPAPGRVESSRVTVVAEEIVTYAPVFESSIIDVPEEPLTMVPEEPVVVPETYRRPDQQQVFEPQVVEQQYAEPVVQPAPPIVDYVPPRPPQPEAPWRPPEARLGRHATADLGQPRSETFAPPPPPRGRHSVPTEGQPVPPGRHWSAPEPGVAAAAQATPAQSVPAQSVPAQSVPAQSVPAQSVPAQSVPAHYVPEESTASEPEGQHADGQSLSDLLSRFNMTVGGGGRRRRED